jgi:hypothetical protein
MFGNTVGPQATSKLLQNQMPADNSEKARDSNMLRYNNFLASSSDMGFKNDSGEINDDYIQQPTHGLNEKSKQLGFNLKRAQMRRNSTSEMDEALEDQNYMMNTNKNLYSIKDQLDGSLTNLFDSLNRPLVHENRFDLT